MILKKCALVDSSFLLNALIAIGGMTVVAAFAVLMFALIGALPG